MNEAVTLSWVSRGLHVWVITYQSGQGVLPREIQAMTTLSMAGGKGGRFPAISLKVVQPGI